MRWEGGEGVIIHLPARARRLRWWAGFRQTRLVGLPLHAARLALVHRHSVCTSGLVCGPFLLLLRLLLPLCGKSGGTAGGGISGGGGGGEIELLLV